MIESATLPPAPEAVAVSGAVSIRRQLVGLAWPIVFARATPILTGLCDTLMVGHLGAPALIATSDGALIASVLLLLPHGVVSLVAAFTAQLHGAGRGRAARRFGFYGLSVAILSQLAALAVLPFVAWGIARLDYAPAVQELMAGYLRIRMLSIGATIGFEALASYSAGSGDTRLPMIAAVSALGINIAGNWLLIDGHLGLPALGVTGSALASTVAATCACGVLLRAFLTGSAESREDSGPLSLRELGSLLRVGLPTGVNWFLELFFFAFFVNVVLAGFGTTTLAATMIVFQISSVTTLPSFALASAGAVLAGQAIGAGRRGDVSSRVILTLTTLLAWQGLLCLAYAAFGRNLLSPFVASSAHAQEVLEKGRILLALSAAWAFFDAVAATYSEALAAAGDTASVMVARAAVFVTVFAPGAWLLSHEFKAGCTSMILWYTASVGLLAWVLRGRFRGGAWLRLRLTD